MQMPIAAVGITAALVLATLSQVVSAQEDYATIRVLETSVIDIPSGPGTTSAILSSDGARVLSLGLGKLCLLAPAQIGAWAELACTHEPRTGDLRIRGPWDMRWSPDGSKLLMPTYSDAFELMRDADIAVFDPETFASTVLTDDGVDGGLLNGSHTAQFDVAARWLDDDTIAFMRYEVPVAGLSERVGPWLMTVEAAGGEPREVSKLLSKDGALVYALAISPDGRQFAYPFEEHDRANVAGIYVSDFGRQPRMVVPMNEVGKSPSGLEFSADGRFLMVLGKTLDFSATKGTIINVETGEVIPIAPGQPLVGAAWSPTGAAVAYLTNDQDNPGNPGGLFVSAAPGEPGRLLIGERFNASTCCADEPFVWASNNTMILGRAEDASTTVLYVQLGQ